MRWQWHQLAHMQIICTFLHTDNLACTSPLSFLQAGCPSCRPANSIQALKVIHLKFYCTLMLICFSCCWQLVSVMCVSDCCQWRRFSDAAACRRSTILLPVPDVGRLRSAWCPGTYNSARWCHSATTVQRRCQVCATANSHHPRCTATATTVHHISSTHPCQRLSG